MSWKIALVVALLCGLITAAVTAPVADKVTGKLGVSDREGGRGMAIAFIFIPLGFVGGLLLGLLGTKLAHAMEWGQFLKALGMGLGLSLAALGAIAGLFLLGVQRPPTLDGEVLDLEAEILVPRELGPQRPVDPRNPRVSLYAGPKDNQYVDVDRGRLDLKADTQTVAVRTRLNSVSGTRMLSLIIDDDRSYTLDMPLQPVPRAEDLQWTAAMPMRLSTITGNGYTFTPVMVRYRVVKAGLPEKD